MKLPTATDRPGLYLAAAFVLTQLAGWGVFLAAQPAADPITTAFKRCPPAILPGEVVAPACLTHGRKLVIAGDSYSWSWQPLALALAKRDGVPVVPFSRGACPPIVGVLEIDNPAETRKCRDRNAELLAYIEANGADMVILSGRWLTHFKPETRGVVEPGLRALVQRITPHVGRIYVVGPTPEMRDVPERCRARDCGVSRGEFDAQAVESRRIMAELDALPKVEVIDPAGWLCDKAACPASRNGVPLYRDANHVTAQAAEAYAAWLLQYRLNAGARREGVRVVEDNRF